MGERKGLAKYYPPDFDPSKLTRIKRPKDGQISSHFMLPMSIRCETCGEFMGAGLKFNAKKSTASETYLGARIYRFSMKCKACPAAFIIRTDPQNSDYACESGAKRNFAAWRADKEKDEAVAAAREDGDEDAMQALENKTLDARAEMEDLDALDELRVAKARNAAVSANALLTRHREVHDGEGEIEEEAKKAFEAKKARMRRRADDDGGGRVVAAVGREDDFTPPTSVLAAEPRGMPAGKRKAGGAGGSSFVVAKKKTKLASSAAAAVPVAARPVAQVKEVAAVSGLVAYGSGDSDSGSSSSSSSSDR